MQRQRYHRINDADSRIAVNQDSVMLRTIQHYHITFSGRLSSRFSNAVLQICNECVRYLNSQSLQKQPTLAVERSNCQTGLTVQAICSPASFTIAFKCHPRRDILSPTSQIFTEESLEAKATTDAGGLPKTYSSGISEVIAASIFLAHPTIALHELMQPLLIDFKVQRRNVMDNGVRKRVQERQAYALFTHILHYGPCTRYD